MEHENITSGTGLLISREASRSLERFSTKRMVVKAVFTEATLLSLVSTLCWPVICLTHYIGGASKFQNFCTLKFKSINIQYAYKYQHFQV